MLGKSWSNGASPRTCHTIFGGWNGATGLTVEKTDKFTGQVKLNIEKESALLSVAVSVLAFVMLVLLLDDLGAPHLLKISCGSLIFFLVGVR